MSRDRDQGHARPSPAGIEAAHHDAGSTDLVAGTSTELDRRDRRRAERLERVGSGLVLVGLGMSFVVGWIDRPPFSSVGPVAGVTALLCGGYVIALARRRLGRVQDGDIKRGRVMAYLEKKMFHLSGPIARIEGSLSVAESEPAGRLSGCSEPDEVDDPMRKNVRDVDMPSFAVDHDVFRL